MSSGDDNSRLGGSPSGDGHPYELMRMTGDCVDFSMYQLRTFWDVAKTKSLTRSARNLGYSQSSVTAHVRALESKVGVTLFHRLPHGVRLTGAGEVFHTYVSQIFTIMDQMSTALKAEGEASGRVIVGSTALLMESEMSDLVRECRYRYPRVQVSLKMLNATQVEGAVASGEVHIGLAFAADRDAGESQHVGVLRQTLFPVQFVPVGARPRGGASAGGSRTIERTQVDRVLVIDPDCASQEVLLRHLAAAPEGRPAVMETGSTRSALSLAGEGLGVAMVPQATAAQDDLVEVLEDLPATEVYVRASWSGDAWMSPAASAFLDLARRAHRPTY